MGVLEAPKEEFGWGPKTCPSGGGRKEHERCRMLGGERRLRAGHERPRTLG